MKSLTPPGAVLTVIFTGGRVLACDPKCYGQPGPQRTCICGGENRGKGYSKAVDNTRASGVRWVALQEAAGNAVQKVEYCLDARQEEPLFTVAEAGWVPPAPAAAAPVTAFAPAVRNYPLPGLELFPASGQAA